MAWRPCFLLHCPFWSPVVLRGGGDGKGTALYSLGHCLLSWHFSCLCRPLLLGEVAQYSANNEDFRSRQNWFQISPLPFSALHSWTLLSLPFTDTPHICHEISLTFFAICLWASDVWGPRLCIPLGQSTFWSPELPGFKPWLCHFLAVWPWVSYPASCLPWVSLWELEINMYGASGTKTGTDGCSEMQVQPLSAWR